jgi:ribosomal protein S18 acetylase RimI-like enzyme
MADNTIGRERPEVYITPADLGRRVSVRRVAEIADGRPVFADVVGVLTSWDNTLLIVRDRHDQLVEIDEKTLVAAKAVPPAPVRRGRRAVAAHLAADPVELQRIAARGWPGVETEPLGDWTMHAAGGFTSRANSVVTGGACGLPLDQALARASAWYGARGLPLQLQLLADDPLDAELAARGWTAVRPALTQTAPLAPLVDDAAAAGVVLTRDPGAAWLSRYRRATDPAHAEAALAVLRGGPSLWFATVPAPGGGAPAAIGRCVVEGRWAGFAAVEVAPEQRRRGLAGSVMAALARAAADEGADLAYLQVEPDNEAAIRLYARLGFGTAYRYHYRRASD